MTLKKALIMKKSLDEYIEGLIKDKMMSSNGLCDLINLKTAIELELTEQTKNYKALCIVADSFKKQLEVAAIDGNLELYKSLQKEYEGALISADNYLFENQFNIEENLMSQFCSYAD